MNRIGWLCFYLLLCTAVFFSCNEPHANHNGTASSSREISETKIWSVPDLASTPNNKEGELIKYGRDLVIRTSLYLGPDGIISHTSNGMNCQNCHLDAGTKIFGNNFSAVASTYPKFRARRGSLETVEQRINDCIERSLNGTVLDTNSREMRAMVAYVKWVGKDVPKDSVPFGSGIFNVPLLERAADAAKGKIVFMQKCVACHANDGQGKKDSTKKYFLYPPLWGKNSFNSTAGLFRLSRISGFVKANMPLGTTYQTPLLTDEEAWDVAAYICMQHRPEKKFTCDWPDVSKKPFDFPFAPYADSFSAIQHKFGPWQAIILTQKRK